MAEPALHITEILLAPSTKIPKPVLEIIEKSLVFSLNELKHAKQCRHTMYISANERGEFIGYCVMTIDFPCDVADELVWNIEGKVAWINAFEIASLHQGCGYGRALIEQIKNKFAYDILLLAVEDSICFWQRTGFKIISCSGEMAYMIFER